MNFKTIILKYYPWLWALFAFLLPLQTRYIARLGLREYGTISLYGIDILFFLLVLVSLVFVKKNWTWAAAWVVLVYFFVSLGMPVAGYWWLRFFEAITVFYLVYQIPNVDRYVLSGFIFGMGINSIFGVVQVAVQQVTGNKWLGMAAQLPWQSGVVVLESQAGRLLRGYGTLPHPNIFGGLTALALLLVLGAREKLCSWFLNHWVYVVAIVIFLLGLWSSFSRSAWLGLLVGLLVFLFQKKISLKLILCVLGAAILLNGLWYQFALGRIFIDNRLEVNSINERIAITETALAIIRSHPWFGVGLGNFTVATQPLLPQQDARYIEPVHNVYLLIVSEVGIIGTIFLVILVMFLIRRLNPWVYSLMATILFIGLFDHYWWTLNSARLIVALFVGLALSQPEIRQGID